MLKHLRLLLTISLVLASVGCARGSTSPSGIGESTATLGTLRFTMDGATRELTATASRDTDDLLTIGGEDTALTIILALQTPAVVGSRSLPDPAVFGAYARYDTYEEAGWLAYGTIGAGTVTIKSLSSTAVSGTFSFTLEPYGTAMGTKVISNGSFNAPLFSN